MSGYQPIKLKVKDRIAHFILDNPPENRMDKRFLSCMCETIHRLERTADVGAVVVYGNGRHFSVGADVDYVKTSVIQPVIEGAAIDDIVNKNVYATSKALSYFESVEIPTIAAVTGLCVGSGLEIALACDIRICGKNCLMGSPELSFGIIPGLGGTVRLQKIVGIPKAKEMILTGEIISGSEAYEIGLANFVAKKKEVVPYALELAQGFLDR